ncbi:hypothetical protein KL86PLE_40253 [uncultured Pleomorphomonas sp.]|uniref:Uncharacterized protein n=1 Tax=uncultured Pleomorphomonas sp. TaxID=442121 RepID=A0A212LG27_9HYPH|nr:hypothetical protein KL86PLE_40253 [uncultured Pleomorphomonas sp.]
MSVNLIEGNIINTPLLGYLFDLLFARIPEYGEIAYCSP